MLLDKKLSAAHALSNAMYLCQSCIIAAPCFLLKIRYLIDGSQTETMGRFELTVLPGANVPPPHSHLNNEEIVYVTQGRLSYSVGENKRDLIPGESMHTQKGVVHAFSNPFSETSDIFSEYKFRRTPIAEF
ncbi:MAG: cupin domain-containing protein [Paralcaligenes sp.]